ncbi:hypothetical protein JJB07_03060 [Tumebacillus sp. ITR2]|uniref:Type II CBASS E2 protein domain-containing protein n=1 Tax=Tumebacillus amylolyticus TaxID=2801339 RepID=A0ABS1J5Z9_9BACL|nr:hypothetical protein [Tumebacillus amylolyticus]MBL0385620.1 hypothetical protein [Tumebacillus amylolyticus]
MKLRYPEFTERISSNRVVWIGKLTPTPLSETYSVLVEFSGECDISIKVISPPLRMRGTEKIPHMYDQERLCLFYPRTQEWDNTKFISKTIIPWTITWLFFYEMWHATGEWLGGGKHPRIPVRRFGSVKRMKKVERGF